LTLDLAFDSGSDRVMNRRLILTLGGACLLTFSTLFLTGGCSVTAPGASGGATTQPVARLDENLFRPIWTDILPLAAKNVVSRIYVDQDLVTALTPTNFVYAISKTDGVLKHFEEVESIDPIGKPVILPGRMIYTTPTTLEIFNRADGKFIKSTKLDLAISSGAVGIGSDLFFGIDLDGGELTAIDLTSPYVPVLWRMIAHGEIRGTPALYQGTLYLGTSDGGVYAVNTDRTPLWGLDYDRYDTGGPVVGDVKADDEGVYASSVSGRLVCLDRNSGRLKWQYLAAEPLQTGPVVTRTGVYQLVPGLGLVALDKTHPIVVDTATRHKTEQTNREQRWNCPEAKQFICEDRLLVYVLVNDGSIWALDRLTGQVRGRSTGLKFAAIATNAADEMIYASTADGVVYALKPFLRPGAPGYLD
jgi:outer membrane protein assembly factor BamB